MGKLIVVQFITIDGVVEDPDGSDGTPFGGWAMRFGPEGIAGDKFRLGDVMSSGTLLFGRRTWDHFATLWPTRDSAFARAMNAADKAVATHRPVDPSTWANSSAIDGSLDDWARRTRAARDVAVIGSGSVVRDLAASDLVDEYRLIAFPLTVGAGRRLFPDPVQLTLTGAEISGPGTLSIYRVH
jgi:dihydrofolate reductase